MDVKVLLEIEFWNVDEVYRAVIGDAIRSSLGYGTVFYFPFALPGVW